MVFPFNFQLGASPMSLLHAQFREGRLETDSKTTQLLRANANLYATLFSSINELKFLRGLDSGEKLDPRDKIRATAARVGLGVPNVR
jgi:hypothetical protein